ncbi:MAG: DNA polymerase I, partial [Acidimicrobiaceae bacterium]|nr:DNA polymerase I [Acidimicrobiaceae bacterium]
MARLMLIDGNSLTYRAFFALPTDMATASGQVTNAVFGFTSMLINLLKDHHPDQVVATFDRPEPTFRHDIVDAYKAGRAETPDILRQQMGLVRQVIETLSIPTVEAPGYEADDVIATLATQAAARGDDVIIVSGDRDTYQLVSDPHIRVLYNRRGVSDYVLYDEGGIEERTGVPPSRYPEYAALRGDPSDNLPGVPGVGEKTAAKLINTYGGIDGIYAHLDEQSPKLRKSLAEAEDTVRKNAAATPLVRDLPIEFDQEAAAVGGWERDDVRKLFDFLEFRTLWDRFIDVTGAEIPQAAGTPESGDALDVSIERPSAAEAIELLDRWRAEATAVAVAGAWQGQEGLSPLIGLALVVLTDAQPGSTAGGGRARGGTPVTWLGLDLLDDADVRAAVGRLVGVDGVEVSAHDAKQLMRGLAVIGVDFSNLSLDPAIAAYLVDPA